MKRKAYDVKHWFSTVLSLTASIASIVGFIFSLLILTENTTFFKLGLGIFASAIGMIVASSVLYFFRRKKKIHVFISHSAKDSWFVKELVVDLMKNSITAHTDEQSLIAGDNLEEKLLEFIANSEYVIIIVSNNTTTSKWIQREFEMAERLNKRILPVMIEDIDDQEIPDFLKNIVYADLRDNYNIGFNFLIRSIKKAK